jgi:hypothetical protein
MFEVTEKAKTMIEEIIGPHQGPINVRIFAQEA